MSRSLVEEWSPEERRKRAKKCTDPKGFTMKQFCKNIKTHSKRGEKTNESITLRILERLQEKAGQLGKESSGPRIVVGLKKIDELYSQLENQISDKDLAALISNVRRMVFSKDELDKDNIFVKAIATLGKNPIYVMDVYENVVKKGAGGVGGPALLAALKKHVRETERLANSPMMRLRGKGASGDAAVDAAVERALLILNMCLKLAEAKAENDAAIEAAAEAPADAPLGRIAFPTHREDKPFEPDTKEETRLYITLKKYFSDNEPLSASDANQIKELISNGLYADVFSAPTSGDVYRGMAVPKSWLMKLLKVKKLDGAGEAEIGATLTPKKNSSSWTVNPDQAEYFSTNPAVRSKDTDMAVILYAHVDDNPGSFIAASQGLYDVEGFDEYAGENEVIGLGPIKIYKIKWSTQAQKKPSKSR